MAKSAEVYAALRIVGASCRGVGSGENWALEVSGSWAEELGHATGKHVMEAARTWIRTEDRRPSLHQFLTLVKQTRGQSVLQDGASGCVDCAESGWRQVVVHWMDARSRQRRAHTYTVQCECEKGRHYAQSVDGRSFRQVIEDFERKPGIIEVLVSDRTCHAFPLAKRLAPWQYERLTKKPRPKRRTLDFEIGGGFKL
jgi:hypothetical protein